MQKEIDLLSEIELSTSQTKRPISGGAEKWLGVPIKCLDHGFVYLVDYMGNDDAIAQAARVSYGQGNRRTSENSGLIRRLRRDSHTSPFEMVELKFHMKLPIFVARQLIRHRTASLNEYSARYSILSNEIYIPDMESLAEQSRTNKQGREKTLPTEEAESVRELIAQIGEKEYEAYKFLLNDDGTGKPIHSDRAMIAREIAREVLGTGFYTEWYWKMDLHNFMHLSKLRDSVEAQPETRIFAHAASIIAKDCFPIAWQAFEDYELNAKKLSALELRMLNIIFQGRRVTLSQIEFDGAAAGAGLTNRREMDEVMQKLKEMGLQIEK